LYSEPDLGQMDTLTWLVLGRAPTGLGRDETALLQRAALALLAGDRDGNSGFLQRLGLDELSVSRAGSGDTASTILILGKQISKRVYVGYQQALGGAGGTWQLVYRIVGSLTLRARTGADNAIDLIWTWRWD
jgi:translocation and assembly module TamB